jgi:hypothetical protein
LDWNWSIQAEVAIILINKIYNKLKNMQNMPCFLGPVYSFSTETYAHSLHCMPVSAFVWILNSSRSLQNQMLSILSCCTYYVSICTVCKICSIMHILHSMCILHIFSTWYVKNAKYFNLNIICVIYKKYVKESSFILRRVSV